MVGEKNKKKNQEQSAQRDSGEDDEFPREVTLADVLPVWIKRGEMLLHLEETLQRLIRRRGGSENCFDNFVKNPDHRVIGRVASILIEAEARKHKKTKTGKNRR